MKKQIHKTSKENTEREQLALPDLKTYYKFSVIETVWYCAQVTKLTSAIEWKAWP